MEFAVALVGALARAVLPVVVSEFKAKLKKPLPCKEDVEKLGDELRLIIANIKDYDESSHGRVISHVEEESVNQLRALAYKIEDCTESFLRQVMSDDGLEKKDTSVKFGADIRGLLTSAKEWNQRFTDNRRTGREPCCAAGAPDTPAQASSGPPVVGIEKPLKELKKLVAEANVKSERKLKVISIVGFGGLGKTLLASQVCNWDDDKKFDLLVWIRADDKNAHQLLEEIFEQVGKNSANNVVLLPAEDVNGPTRTIFDWLRPKHTEMRACTSIPNYNAVVQDKGKAKVKENGMFSYRPNLPVDYQLVENLKALLENKRYLIIIIDMRKKEQWCGISGAFSRTSEIDSRIIVTTTKLPVAKAICDGGGYMYKMSALTDDDSRKLFLHSKNLPLGESAETILHKCGGLPLALICLSENCKGELENMKKRSEEVFLKICGPQDAYTSKNPRGNTPSERMRQMLLNSYHDLPNYFVKVCLLYLGMFPPDHDNVTRNSVIRRLLAEGLAQTGDGKAVNDFEALIDHCVAQSTEVSNNGKTKRCKVFGMVLEYITRMTKSQGFVTVCDDSQTAQPPPNSRRLSLHPSSQWKLPEEMESKVRTLAVFGKKDEATTLSNKEAIAKYELLRVLDLEGCGGLDRSDLRNFCHKLLLLKYLSLGASITEVPKSIRKLQMLETLDLRKTKIDMVPLEVIMLPQLKNLLGKFRLDEDGIFSKWERLKGNNIVKKKLATFFSLGDSKLERLSGFVTGSNHGFPQLLSYMINLRKVKTWCQSNANQKNMDNLSEGIQKFFRLTRKDNGRSLSLDISDCPEVLSVNFLKSLMGTDSAGSFTTATTSSVNTSSAPTPPSLYSFKLYGKIYFDTTPRKGGFPEFLTKLDSITELCLSGTDLKPDELLGGLNRLPKSTLKYLKLVEKKLGSLKLSTDIFTSLVRICLVAEEKTENITISDGALPSLVSLHVLCKGLDGLSGINIRRFPELKEVGLHPGLDAIERGLWETAANNHPNWPNLALINPPKSRTS